MKKISLIAFLMTAPVFALRIISTSPQLTDIIIFLGKGADIIATGGDYAPFPSIGALFSLSIERLVFYDPDWVIVDNKNANRSFLSALRYHHYKFLKIDINNIESFFSETRRILKLIYGESENIFLNKFESCFFKIPPEKSFTYIAFIWLYPLIVFGKRTFFSEFLTKIGGVNIVDVNFKLEFPKLSHEWFFSKNVDVVFYFPDYPRASEKIKELIRYWWPSKKPQLIELNPDLFMRAGFSPFLDKNVPKIGDFNRKLWSCVEN